MQLATAVLLHIQYILINFYYVYIAWSSHLASEFWDARSKPTRHQTGN